MNIQSILLAAAVAVAFVLALVRFVKKQRRGGSCSCGSQCDHCSCSCRERK